MSPAHLLRRISSRLADRDSTWVRPFSTKNPVPRSSCSATAQPKAN